MRAVWFLPGLLYVGLYLNMVGVGGALFNRLLSANKEKRAHTFEECKSEFLVIVIFLAMATGNRNIKACSHQR